MKNGDGERGRSVLSGGAEVKPDLPVDLNCLAEARRYWEPLCWARSMSASSRPCFSASCRMLCQVLTGRSSQAIQADRDRIVHDRFRCPLPAIFLASTSRR